MSRRRQALAPVGAPSVEDVRSDELAGLEARLRSSLSSVVSLWDDMITPPARSTSPAASGDGAILDDDSESTADMPRVVVVVETRMHVSRCLASWAGSVAAEHRVRHGLPDVHDGKELGEFLLRWSSRLVERPDVEELLDDVRTCESLVTRCARPQRKTWLSLGPCPLQYEHPDTGQMERCPGEVRSSGSTDEVEGQSWATCSACGQRAVASWWEEQMFGGSTSEPLTTDQVITFVHRVYGRVVKRTAIQMWVARGDLASCGKDDQGRRLYDRAAVAWAIDRQEKRRAGDTV